MGGGSLSAKAVENSAAFFCNEIHPFFRYNGGKEDGLIIHMQTVSIRSCRWGQTERTG
jgi:hypothetical protein